MRVSRLQLVAVTILCKCNNAFAFSSRIVHSLESTKSTLSVSSAVQYEEDPSPIERKRPSRLSRAAQWHQDRRKTMISKYEEIGELEKSSSMWVGVPLLFVGNLTLLSLSLLSGSLSIPAVFGLAICPGSIFSLWQLQILHDCLHGTLLNKELKKKWQHKLLFWGSMPSVFGYYLYLKYGHLTHHKNVGGNATLYDLFDSSQVDFEDGDMLFVSHRMKIKGDIGPQFSIGEKKIKLSISRSGFHFWQTNHPVSNAFSFTVSFLFERFMLVWNDIVVALTGRNFFFPNKPDDFHRECATYTRCAVALRLGLYLIAGWKSILFLYLSETLWSLPPHPACAMFITNHGSLGGEEECQPSSSTYAGPWYSLMTLGTNYHCEHHDFPSIPFHLLGRLHKIAPEFYPSSAKKDNIFTIMKNTFAEPDFYACSNANNLKDFV